MIETVVVILIVATAVIFAVRSICRTISGKDGKCSCGCDICTCHMHEKSTKPCAGNQPNYEGKEV